MPSRPQHYCATCRKVHGDACPKRKAWHGRRSGNTTQRGYGHQWRKVRAYIFMRDSGLCQPCLKQSKYVQAVAVDHIIPKAQGGTDEPANLQAICDPCHKVKTAREGGV